MSGRSAPEIQAWLTRALAKELRVPEGQVDPKAPFEEMGLDSMVAVELSGDLADWLGTKVSPTVVWDYPNIESLVQYLERKK
jgi:acyl carrier protein